MSRALTLGLAVSVALAACGRPSPLQPTRAPSSAAASQSAPQVGTPTPDAASPEAAPPPADTDASSVDAGSAEPVSATAAADATVDAGRDVVPSEGGSGPYRAIGVATGEVHTCAILDDHRVKCWGNNSFGQLGYGDTRDRGGSPADMGDNLPTVDFGTGRTAVAIAASRYATCAILDDGSLKCWGWTGLLGEIDVQNVGQAEVENVGDNPGEMGDQLPALDFGGRRAVHLAMGEVAACASMDDDTIWCWDGDKPWPQFWLPAKRVSALAPAGGGLVAVYDEGSVSPMLPNGRVPVFTSEHKVLAIAGAFAGAETTCLLLDDGTTTCLGPGTPIQGPAHAIAIGVERPGGLCSALSDGSVNCQSQTCLQPTYYQCTSDGSFALGAPAVTVTSNGTNFACALLVDGNIKCWDGSSTGPLSVWLGSEFAVTTQSDGGITYGAWHAVDLGTHP